MNVYFNFQTTFLLMSCMLQTTHTAYDYSAYEARDIKKAATSFNLSVGATTAGASVLAHIGKIKPAQPILFLSTLTAMGNIIIIHKKINQTK